jgi:putative chitinase
MITEFALRTVLRHAPPPWLAALLEELPHWGLDTDNEIASFIAQVAHESMEFTRFTENLSYSAERLQEVWRRRFPTIEVARRYERNPMALANFVYANRLGNGSPESGDGWRFRGRGPIQITGRRNYQACAKGINAPLLEQPELLLTPAIGIRSACWYWASRGLDRLDDDDDVLAETRAVNGGTHGLAQRQAYFDNVMRAIAGGN